MVRIHKLAKFVGLGLLLSISAGCAIDARREPVVAGSTRAVALEELHDVLTEEMEQQGYRESIDQTQNYRRTWAFDGPQNRGPIHAGYAAFSVSQVSEREFGARCRIGMDPLCGNDPNIRNIKPYSPDQIDDDVCVAIERTEARLTKLSGMTIKIRRSL